MRWLLFFLLMLVTMSCHKAVVPRSEQSLRVPLRKDPHSLDPRKGNDMVASQIHFMLFEGLMRLNPDMSLSLAQAEAYEISSDGKMYTFYLKDTVWSDGSAVTSFDFEKSWKRILDRSFGSPDAYLLYPIKHARQAQAGEISIDQVGIYSQGPKTLIVELESPSPYFLQIVASSVLLPICADAEEREPNWSFDADKIVSNGPFTLKEWAFQQHLRFEKNPLYREAGQVQLNQIWLDIVNNEMATLRMHASGHFDLIGAPLSFFPSILLEDLEKRKLLESFPVAATKFLAFNTTGSALQSKNIRKALGLAVNRKALVHHITKLHEKEALNIIPPALCSINNLYFLDADIMQAKECLQKGMSELQIEHLPPLTLIYVASEVNHLLAQALQHMWASALGVEVILEHVEFKTLHERARKGDFSIGLFAWVADYADPMNILERFANKANHRNYSKWENQSYNCLLKEALTESCPSAYIEKVQQAENFLIQEMPFTCLFHENYTFLIHPHVQNFTISPLGHIYLDKISIRL